MKKNGNCREIIKFKKDFRHPTLFMFGTIQLPFVNKVENKLYFHPVGVKEDNRTFRVRNVKE
ncbi:MAG: hypothetical protein H0U50_14340 [Pyrinomonadaceae bacterium]|nr:hypothetical protein [Pyrinomonadaceae bacterium]